jgi:hypothetical protein
VYFMQGSPLTELNNCNIARATNVLFLAQYGKHSVHSSSLDAKNILAYRNVRVSTFGIVDMISRDNCAFLGSDEMVVDDYMYSSYYAAGHAFSMMTSFVLIS